RRRDGSRRYFEGRVDHEVGQALRRGLNSPSVVLRTAGSCSALAARSKRFEYQRNCRLLLLRQSAARLSNGLHGVLRANGAVNSGIVYTRPSTITRRILATSLISRSGSPTTKTRSASLPASTEPRSLA